MPCAAANSGAAMSRTPTNAAERADFMFTSEIHKSATAYEPDLTAFSRLILSRSTLRAGRLFFESSSRSSLLLEHDLFRKPVSTFRDHALVNSLRHLRRQPGFRACRHDWAGRRRLPFPSVQ